MKILRKTILPHPIMPLPANLVPSVLWGPWERGGAEKLELSSKNLDSTPPPKQKKLVLTPLCYVKNNVAPPPLPPHW